MKVRYLIKRILGRTQGARIIHTDGRVTECRVIRDQAPRFGMRHRWVVVIPPGTEVNKGGDELYIDRIPSLTSVEFVFPEHPNGTIEAEEGT